MTVQTPEFVAQSYPTALVASGLMLLSQRNLRRMTQEGREIGQVVAVNDARERAAS